MAYEFATPDLKEKGDSLGMCSPCMLCGLVAKLCFLKDVIYLFLERGEGREKERERNIDV